MSLPALALALGVLACRMLTPGTPLPAAAAAPVATSPAEATAFAPARNFTLVRIYPKDGPLHSLLAAEVRKARARGQAPFVEFDATWCPPCQAITASLAQNDKAMLRAYAGIYLIHADVDQWGWDNTTTGFPVVTGIPAFFALDDTGTPTGATVDGGAWGADTPANIAPVLTKFFHPQGVFWGGRAGLSADRMP